MTLALVIGAGFGGSLYFLWIALLPPRTDLVAAVGRYDAWRTRRRPPGTEASVVAKRRTFGGTASTNRWREQLGVRLAAALARRGFTFGQQSADLDLLGRTLDAHLARKVLAATGGVLLPSILSASLLVGGIGTPWVMPVLGGLALGAVLFVIPDIEVRQDASKRRDELRHALGSFLDLVSMSMAGGRGVPEAIPMAAAIGQSWAFSLINDSITRARYTGVTPWVALEELGSRVKLPELVDLGAALTLVADDGARVRQTLAARAKTLRRRELAEAEGDAANADQSMRVAQILLAAGFLIFLGYPAVARILAT